MRRRRSLAILLAAGALAGWSGLALAFWTAAGAGAASGSVATLDAAAISVPPTSSGSVAVTWTQQATLTPSSAGNSSITYSVERRSGVGAFTAVTSGGCAGPLPHGTTSCTDTPPSGTYDYRVVATLHSWGATSAVAGPVVVADTTPPAVSAIDRAGSSPTNASSVDWNVTYSESVTGVDAGDFQLQSGGSVSGATITSVSGSGSSYTVTAATGSGSGTLGLNLVDDDSIADTAGNKLGGTGVGNGNFTGQAYTLDRTAPALSSLQMLDVDGNGKVDRVTASFNETLASSTATAPWTLTNVPSGGTLASVSTSGSTATLTINEGAGAATTAVGPFQVALAANASGIRDTVGNQSSFAATAPADAAAPAPTLLQMFDVDTDGKVDRTTVAFSETLASSTATAPWTLAAVPSNGTLASVSTSGATATLTIAEGAGAADTAVGSYTVALAASTSGIRDATGNQSSFAATAPQDKASPVPVSLTDTNGSANGELQTGDTLAATFSEAIASGVDASTTITESQALLSNTTLSIPGFTSGALNMGSGNYLLLTGTAVFNATAALSNADKTLTVTAGSCASGCASPTAGTGTTMSYVPAATLLDAAGNAAAGSVASGFRIF